MPSSQRARRNDIPRTPIGHAEMWVSCTMFGALAAWALFGPWQWMGSSHVAAWVQAAGVLLGIGVAIYAPLHHAAEIERRKGQQQLNALTAMAAAVAGKLEYLHGVVNDAALAQEVLTGLPPVNVWRDRGEAIKAVPLHTLPDDRLVDSILRLRTLVWEVTCWLEKMHAARLADPRGQAPYLRRLAVEAEDIYEEVNTVYRSFDGTVDHASLPTPFG